MNRRKVLGMFAVVLIVILALAFPLTLTNGCNPPPTPTCPPGPQGPKGDKGDKGDTGATGPQGPQGPAGKDGKNGVNGKNGIDGIDGINGMNGVDGKDGINGTDGKDGCDGIDGVNGTDGKDGCCGKDGNTWHFGTADPCPTFGEDGDLYLNYATMNVFGKIGGAWALLGNIKGEQGLQGIAGINGMDGVNGLNGLNGEDGGIVCQPKCLDRVIGFYDWLIFLVLLLIAIPIWILAAKRRGPSTPLSHKDGKDKR